jgi:MFS transporter, PHS family, inorganic phosphate transporter
MGSHKILAGPNATTFIAPAEIFPTRLRATAHGLSAAAGKIGAIIAQVAITPLTKKGARPGDKNQNPWLNHVMQIFALFMFCGILTSLFVPESKRKTLEELSGEKEDEEVYELNFRESFWSNTGSIEKNQWREKWGMSAWRAWAAKYLHLR